MKEQNKQRKIIIVLFSVLPLLAITLIIIFKYPERAERVKTTQEDLQPEKKDRSLASHMPTGPKKTSPQPPKKQDSQSSQHNHPVARSIKAVNKPQPNIEEKVINQLKKNLTKDYAVTILKSTPHLYKQHKNIFHAHKIDVKITDKDGVTSSYRILADSETGRIIRSWAPTHYERKPSSVKQSTNFVPLITN